MSWSGGPVSLALRCTEGGRKEKEEGLILLCQDYHLLPSLHKLSGDVAHGFHVVCEGGSRRPGVSPQVGRRGQPASKPTFLRLEMKAVQAEGRK